MLVANYNNESFPFFTTKGDCDGRVTNSHEIKYNYINRMLYGLHGFASTMAIRYYHLILSITVMIILLVHMYEKK